MNSLQIQDGFEPYFAGREAFPKPKPTAHSQRQTADEKRRHGGNKIKAIRQTAITTSRPRAG